ncbi:MAG: ribbon-helix-helix protein, CopG family [Magnetococcales bacterium]|nr:ribbon-helix-helix protein, CopG family [Magnetococcales bacterium]
MAVMTIKLPDDQLAKLEELARERGMTLDSLVVEMASSTLAQYDPQIVGGDEENDDALEGGLAVLDELDRVFGPWED